MENTKGLLRQYWPKKPAFKQVLACDVDEVIEKLNNRPRKILNYQTPAKLVAEHTATVAALIVMHCGVECASLN
jgi:IS30 family transposase